MTTLILGIGNLLLGDEGVGVHVAHALQQESLPDDVTVLEVGTAFLDALPAIEAADRIFLIDAMQADGTPGTVYRVPYQDCAQRPWLASLHGFDVARVLYLSGRTTAPDVLVIGIEPARIEWGTELSPAVRRVLPAVIDVIQKEIAGVSVVNACRNREMNGSRPCLGHYYMERNDTIGGSQS